MQRTQSQQAADPIEGDIERVVGEGDDVAGVALLLQNAVRVLNRQQTSVRLHLLAASAAHKWQMLKQPRFQSAKEKVGCKSQVVAHIFFPTHRPYRKAPSFSPHPSKGSIAKSKNPTKAKRVDCRTRFTRAPNKTNRRKLQNSGNDILNT
jgi:hypothetical protein